MKAGKSAFETFIKIFFLGFSIVLGVSMIGFASYHRGYQDGAIASQGCVWGANKYDQGECAQSPADALPLIAATSSARSEVYLGGTDMATILNDLGGTGCLTFKHVYSDGTFSASIKGATNIGNGEWRCLGERFVFPGTSIKQK